MITLVYNFEVDLLTEKYSFSVEFLSSLFVNGCI